MDRDGARRRQDGNIKNRPKIYTNWIRLARESTKFQTFWAHWWASGFHNSRTFFFKKRSILGNSLFN